MDNITKVIHSIPVVTLGQRQVVAIDGLSRSGKTTLVNNIHKLLQEKDIPVHNFHIDDYITDKKTRYNTGHKAWYEYYQLQWNAVWLRNNFFNKLRTSKELHLPLYNPKTESHVEQTVTLPETTLIIIEGIFLQREEWRDVYDYIIFLDVNQERRFNRESEAAKQNTEKFRSRYWKAEDYYMNTVNPKERANLVILN